MRGAEPTKISPGRRAVTATTTHNGRLGDGAPVMLGDVAADPRLYNEDLAPVPKEKRTWTGYSIFAMWMSDVHSVGGYTFAASLFLFGLTGWQVLSRWRSAS